MNLDQFAEEIHQEVLARCEADASEFFKEGAFTETLIEYLVQANEVDDGEVCFHKHNSRAEKLNGYSLSGDGECLDLFVTCYHGTTPPPSVPNTEVNNHFRWVRRFFEGALKKSYTNYEETSPAFDIAQQIDALKAEITKVRIFLLTDGVVRNAEVEDVSVDGVEIRHFVWDMEKLRRFITSRMQREVISVDFESAFGGPVPCLATEDGTGEYQSFLAFFPGTLLAKLYGDYGPRLLEKNVRSFLQAKGNVNKGIRTTIQSEAHRFLAYNNGISATASAVELDRLDHGFVRLKSARDFQIVNGGQTTASIYHAAKRDKADVSKVSVQVKLTVLNNPEHVDVFVPYISRYANSQNKVNAADFSANQPFHVKMEELSRRLWAPAASGTERQTRWYYERARGSYLDDKSREGTSARMRQFEAINPLRQKFTKTDLAKFENSWNQYPHFVCLGAEKNFLKFTDLQLQRPPAEVDEVYFQRLMAKGILFRSAEKIVGAQEYGGFRANIVTYTIAWLSHRTAQRIDLGAIWASQKISEPLANAIALVSKYANDHITSPPPNRRNPGEWSKKEECWERFREIDIKLPADFDAELVDISRTLQTDHSAVNIAGNGTGVVTEEMKSVTSIAPDVWFKIAKWAKETDNLAPWQRSISFSIGRLVAASKTPSEKQAKQAMILFEEAKRRGFKPDA